MSGTEEGEAREARRAAGLVESGELRRLRGAGAGAGAARAAARPPPLSAARSRAAIEGSRLRRRRVSMFAAASENSPTAIRSARRREPRRHALKRPTCPRRRLPVLQETAFRDAVSAWRFAKSLQFPEVRVSTNVCACPSPSRRSTDEIRELAADMLEVMYDEPGIGLAAPQVGESIRLIVLDTDWTEEGAEPKPGGARQPGDPRARWHHHLDRGLPLGPRLPVRGGAVPEGPGPRARSGRQRADRGGRGVARRLSCSTRSITWTVCSSSTESAG